MNLLSKWYCREGYRRQERGRHPSHREEQRDFLVTGVGTTKGLKIRTDILHTCTGHMRLPPIVTTLVSFRTEVPGVSWDVHSSPSFPITSDRKEGNQREKQGSVDLTVFQEVDKIENVRVRYQA